MTGNKHKTYVHIVLSEQRNWAKLRKNEQESPQSVSTASSGFESRPTERHAHLPRPVRSPSRGPRPCSRPISRWFLSPTVFLETAHPWCLLWDDLLMIATEDGAKSGWTISEKIPLWIKRFFERNIPSRFYSRDVPEEPEHPSRNTPFHDAPNARSRGLLVSFIPSLQSTVPACVDSTLVSRLEPTAATITGFVQDVCSLAAKRWLRKATHRDGLDHSSAS